MVLPLYLALTAAEISRISSPPALCAYMACHFSPYTEGISNEALLEQLVAKYPGAESDFAIHGNGPAVYLRIPGFTGSVGFISAIHGKFCRSCNRMRLTSTGLLKPCLCYDTAVDLRSILRSGRTREERAERLAWAFARACGEKPEEHCFDREEEITETRKMVQIGG